MSETTDPLNIPYRERERSITMDRYEHEPQVGGDPLADELESTEELFTINIGPHHPATHGVLRLLTTLEGEHVRRVVPIIGYVNAAVYCKAVEELLNDEVPPRAQYLRVIHLELNRIASHLFWLGTSILDLGAMSMIFYALRERERVLDLFEMSSGQRLHTRYFQAGGCIEDIPPGFDGHVRKFLADFPSRVSQYEDILDKNEIFLQRMKGTGMVSREELHGLSVTGPLLRCTGDPWDLRKASPYWGYEQYDFGIPVGTVGDNYDRYMVRIAEMRESVKIVEQALDGLPEGPYISDDRKVALPPRHELATSMEALIHHFKLVTEGFRVPPGEHYAAIESPRGELGCFVVADGSAKPARVHMRDPSFHNLQALPPMCEGGLVADMIASVAMLDPILGGVDR